MKKLLLALVFLLSSTTAAWALDSLQIEETHEGKGPVVRAGQTISVHYTGWLLTNGAKGNKFDSSLDRGKPFKFQLGSGMVIRGWEEGIAGMRVGSKRVLKIPSTLGYGERGAGKVIPPNSDLIFEVHVVDVK